MAARKAVVARTGQQFFGVGGRKMGKLRIMSTQGDRTVEWGNAPVDAADQEGLEAVREAERIFREELRKGATAFRVIPGTPAKRLERFDPDAEQIVMVPRVAGG